MFILFSWLAGEGEDMQNIPCFRVDHGDRIEAEQAAPGVIARSWLGPHCGLEVLAVIAADAVVVRQIIVAYAQLAELAHGLDVAAGRAHELPVAGNMAEAPDRFRFPFLEGDRFSFHSVLLF